MAYSLAAVVATVHEPLEVQQVPFPDIEPGGVLVKVEAATLCGTDVHVWEGVSALPDGTPYIPGHETCGTIVEIGGRRTDLLDQPLKVGDRIIATYPFCGHCYYCTVARQAVLCPHVVPYGRVRSDKAPYLLGGCAQHHYFPPGCDIIRVPDEVSSPLAASAACALRTIMHGFEKLGRLGSHETVLVQGAGPVGLYAAAVARDRGASTVVMIGAPAERLNVARGFGVDASLDLEAEPDAARRKQWVLDQTSGRGPDVVLQCAGSPAIVEGLDLVRRGGRLVSIGATGGTISIPGGIFTGKYVDVLGIVMAEGRHFYEAVNFLATRRKEFTFDQMITGTYQLNHVTEALQAMAEFREVKPVVVPN
ncbi:MAG TPA: zinc-binding dehydrogenase [Chloroflexota bacterium]|jgi:threonine dehydrogenase-like Zn-dependent dehydrogenase|nr:zinc-binding dehydrogenase [Chloroflexota bacterium]